MPCLECGTPTGGAPLCPPHAQQARNNPKRSAPRPSAHARGYDGAWRALRAQILADQPQCHYCPAPATTVDHLIPLSVDPSLRLDPRNLVPACRRCNSSKKDRTTPTP